MPTARQPGPTTLAPPGWPGEPAGQLLHISAMARRVFGGPPAIEAQPGHRPHLREYLSDMVGPYGLSLGDDLRGHSYGEMGAALVSALVSPERPVDLLVVAFAIPDVRPGRAVATYLSHLCPGRPLALAICDQGNAAAFTGLRLVQEYARSGCQRALLLVLEQAGLPYDAGQPVEPPAVHAAVGLLCEAGGDAATVDRTPLGSAAIGSAAVVRTIRQHAGVAPERVVGLLTDELAAAGNCTPIVNHGLLPGARIAPAGQPHTGVWWALADALDQPGRVVLATHDLPLGYLCMSTIDIPEGG